jgi:hypothetical protein
VKTTAANPAVANAVNLNAVAAEKEKPNIMIRVPGAIGICATIVLGAAVSACANGGGNSVAHAGNPAATSGDCAPGVCVGSTPGSTPDMIQFQDKVQ